MILEKIKFQEWRKSSKHLKMKLRRKMNRNSQTTTMKSYVSFVKSLNAQFSVKGLALDAFIESALKSIAQVRFLCLRPINWMN